MNRRGLRRLRLAVICYQGWALAPRRPGPASGVAPPLAPARCQARRPVTVRTIASLTGQTPRDVDRTISIPRLAGTQGWTVFQIPSTPVGIWFTVRPWPSPRRCLRCVPCLAGAPPERWGPASCASSPPSSTGRWGGGGRRGQVRRGAERGRAHRRAAAASRREAKPPWCRATRWRRTRSWSTDHFCHRPAGAEALRV